MKQPGLQRVLRSATRVRRGLIVGGAMAMMLLPNAGTSWAADVAVLNQQLVFKGTGDANDIVDIQPLGPVLEVYDATDELKAGPGCVNLSIRLVTCASVVLGIEVDGGAGNDLIGVWDVPLQVNVRGGDGDDFIESGSASDSLVGGAGDDGLIGGDGDDRLAGGDGDDVLSGGDGADTAEGNAGDDVLDGGPGGGDVVLGGPDRDLIRGGDGGDRLEGDEGDDAIVGGTGKDQINGGSGENEIFGTDGQRDALRCGRRDRVRADPAERVKRCGRLLRQARVPTVWPPLPPGAESLNVRLAQLPPPDAKTRAVIRRPGKPRKTSVCIRHSYHTRVRVTVRTYNRQHRRIKTFRFSAATKSCKTKKRPSPGRNAVRARARISKSR